MLSSLASPLDVRTRALAPLNRLCLSITAALAISSFASVTSPSRVSAETASVQDALEEEILEQESLEQVAVAFGILTWIPRLESACDLYKEGFFAESKLPEAYRILYETYGVQEKSPESGKALAKLLELIKGGSQAWLNISKKMISKNLRQHGLKVVRCQLRKIWASS